MAGFDPNEDPLILSEGADFVASYTEAGVTWPEGTTCVLSFPEVDPPIAPISATINPSATVTLPTGGQVTGGTASLIIPRADTTAAKLPKGTRYQLHLTKEGVRHLWFRGKVERQD